MCPGIGCIRCSHFWHVRIHVCRVGICGCQTGNQPHLASLQSRQLWTAFVVRGLDEAFCWSLNILFGALRDVTACHLWSLLFDCVCSEKLWQIFLHWIYLCTNHRIGYQPHLAAFTDGTQFDPREWYQSGAIIPPCSIGWHFISFLIFLPQLLHLNQERHAPLPRHNLRLNWARLMT